MDSAAAGSQLTDFKQLQLCGTAPIGHGITVGSQMMSRNQIIQMIETPAITEQTIGGALSSRGGAGWSAEKQLVTQRMLASPENGRINLETLKCYINLDVAQTSKKSDPNGF